MSRGTAGRYSLRGPCSNCPFRSDKPFYLHPERVDEIADSLERGESFSCHKHNDFDEDGQAVPTQSERECGGVMATLEREERPNQMMRIAERLGMYNPANLDPNAPVFDSIEEWRDAMHELA